MHEAQSVIDAIDGSPLNRGLKGADWLASPGNVPIISGDDITLFDNEGEGTYQVHFLYKSTGRKAITTAQAAFTELFDKHGAELIFGLVPSELRHAKIHARLVGGRYAGVRATSFGPCELFVLAREQWKGDVE